MYKVPLPKNFSLLSGININQDMPRARQVQEDLVGMDIDGRGLLVQAAHSWAEDSAARHVDDDHTPIPCNPGDCDKSVDLSVRYLVVGTL